MSFQCHLADVVSTKNSSDILIFCSLCLFLLVVWKKSSLFLDFGNLVITFYVILFLLFEFCWDSWISGLWISSRLEKLWPVFLYFFLSFSFPQLLEPPDRCFLTHYWYSDFFPKPFFPLSVYLILKGFCCYVFINIH